MGRINRPIHLEKTITKYGDEGYLLAYPIAYSEEDIKSTINFL